MKDKEKIRKLNINHETIKIDRKQQRIYDGREELARANMMPFNHKQEWEAAGKEAKEYYKKALERKINVAEKNYMSAYDAYNKSSIRGPEIMKNLMKADKKLSSLNNIWHENYGSSAKNKKK